MWFCSQELTNILEEYENMAALSDSSKLNKIIKKEESGMENSGVSLETKENNQNSQNNFQLRAQAPLKKWSHSDFAMGKKIADGSFGALYTAKEINSNKVIVMKILFKSNIEKKQMRAQVITEIEIHTHLKHPNILRMYGYFRDETRIYMILQFAPGGDLLKALQAEPSKRFADERAASYLRQLTEAVKFIHSKNVIHRDLRPENLLLDEHNVLKLTDFGWAVHKRIPRPLAPCGVLKYMAPEVHLNEDYDKAVDLWAIGVVAFQLLSGVCPFELGSSVEDLLENIIRVDFVFPDFVAPPACDLISKLLVRAPGDRLTPENILNHEWIIHNH